MPYIAAEERSRFDDYVDTLGVRTTTSGELAYVISRLCHVYVYENSKDTSYAGLAEVLSTLDTCKLEYYLETMKPYEDYKKSMNGDLFDHDNTADERLPRWPHRVGEDGGLDTSERPKSPNRTRIGPVRKTGRKGTG